MTSAQASHRVSYDVRPAKQVERRMLIDACQHLAEAGFAIKDYQYTGMGSFYFVDFTLFHRLLGINRLLSVEKDGAIRKRIEFNRPFQPVKLEIAPIGDIIPTLDRATKHLLWLDYNYELNIDCVQDIAAAAAGLSTGSLLLVTVNAAVKERRTAAEQFEYLSQRASEYFAPTWTAEDCAPSRLPATIASLLCRIVASGMAARRSVTFEQLFGFEYADSTQMVTIGGMIAGRSDRTKLKAAGLDGLPFIRRSSDETLYRIFIPPLTRRERLYLDQFMPCADGWIPNDFELPTRDVEAYRQVYRYLPLYAELLL